MLPHLINFFMFFGCYLNIKKSVIICLIKSLDIFRHNKKRHGDSNVAICFRVAFRGYSAIDEFARLLQFFALLFRAAFAIICPPP